MILLAFLCNCINRLALLQEGCDIIGPLSNGVNRRGSYAGRLLYLLAFYIMVSIGEALMQGGCDSIVFFM